MVRKGAAAIALTLMAMISADKVSADEATLGGAAQSTGRYFGAALAPDYLDEKPYRELAQKQLTSVTPENQMKWEAVEPLRGDLTWSAADKLVEFARANGQKIRGHTLVWHSQLPQWLVQGEFSRSELKELMVAHIAAEVGRYKGSIYAWDVVNEPFTDDGAWRKSIWYEAMGPDYVAIALKAARAADPAAKLYVNDYNVETDGPKMQALHDLVASLKRQGAPIDGVGLQSHFVAGATPADLQSVMARFAALDVDVAVTELDVRVRTPSDEKSLAAQAADYGAVARACRQTPRCVGVTTWGVSDDHSWVPGFFSGYGDALPYDESYRAKPAAAALIRGLTEP
jgi:endo-1,4-beta-xylanase